MFILFHIRVKLDILSHTRMHTLYTWGQVHLSVSPSQHNLSNTQVVGISSNHHFLLAVTSFRICKQIIWFEGAVMPN